MAAKRKRRAPPKKTAKKTDVAEEEAEETDKSLNETMESEENPSTEDGASQNGEGLDDEGESDVKVKKEVKEEVAYDDDDENEANGEEPPSKKVKGEGGEKLTLFLANLPPDTKPEAIKEALEEAVGEGKVLTLRQSTRRRPTFYSSSTIYFADVVDRETLEKLIALDQKLQIGGQEVIIEEDKKRDDSLKIVISNIPEESNNKETLLNLLAAQLGGPEKVEVVRVIIDKKTSQPSDTAHIYLTDTDSVKHLVDLDPKLNINGQELLIEESEANKTKREKLKLFIGRIPIDSCNEDAVRAALEKEVGEGKVLAIRCPKDWMTGRPRGIAFANCVDEETVKKLTSLDAKIKINDQEINIMENELNAKKDELFKLFISNLPQATTEEKFKAKIQEVMTEDEIESITFPLDMADSKSRGFAFIILKNSEAMKKLLALDQKLELDNCDLNIRVCHEAHADSRGRGGKRGFKGRDSWKFGGGRGRGGGFYGGRGGGGFRRGGYSDWYGGPGGPRNFRGGRGGGGWKRGGGGYGGGYGGGGGGGRYGNMTWF